MGTSVGLENDMKILLKWFVYSGIFTALLIAGYIMIFSWDVIVGAVVWLVYLFLCFIIFCVSIFGLVKGNLNFMKLLNRIEITGLFIASILLTLIMSVFLFLNALLDYGVKGENYTLEQKTRFIGSMFAQVPSRKDMLKEEKKGITYYYAEDTKLYVEKMDTFLRDDELDPFMVEIHNDSKVFEANFLLPKDLGGYYNFMNKSIHVLPNEDDWESVLLHEYTHYRIHQFSKKHDLSINRLPQWFQEGVGEYFGSKQRFAVNLDTFRAVDFHLLDSNDTYHKTTGNQFNPYDQSLLAVNALVNNHGIEVIPELMMSNTIEEFYVHLEKTTGQNETEFQQSLLSDLKAKEEAVMNQFTLVNHAIVDQKYDEAEVAIAEIKEIGNKYDIDYAEYLNVQILLEQGLYTKIIEFIESRNATEDYGFKTNNLLTLAESYLVIGNNEKALEAINKVSNELHERKTIHLYSKKIDSAIDAYEKINSSNPLAGYRKLFEEDLIVNQRIKTDLLKKLKAKYPNEF